MSVRVVSMPCVERFDAQDPDYREHVLPPGPPCLAVEAGSTDSWWRVIRGNGGVIGMHGFGASAPADELFAHFGFTVEALVQAALELLE